MFLRLPSLKTCWGMEHCHRPSSLSLLHSSIRTFPVCHCYKIQINQQWQTYHSFLYLSTGFIMWCVTHNALSSLGRHWVHKLMTPMTPLYWPLSQNGVTRIIHQNAHRSWSLSNSTKQSTFWEVNRSSASQENTCILWTPDVHYSIQNSHHWSLFWARWIQSTPSQHISLRLILIFSHQCMPRS